jgi:hypothetical protein
MLPTWLPNLWTRLPKEVRGAFLVALVVGIVSACIVIAYLAWESGYLRERLGGVATTKDIEHQTNQLQEQGGELMQGAVHQALQEYDQNLRAYLDAERSAAVDTILTPMLFALKELDKRQRQMLAATDANARRLDELPKAYDQKLERLITAADGGGTTTLLKDIIERLEAQDKQLRELQAGPDGRRISKQKF